MSLIKKSLRKFVKAVLPVAAFERLAATRSRRWQVNFLRREGLLDQVEGYLAQHGATVQAGPFAGLVYPRQSAAIRWCLPKLLGTYEQEVHPFLSRVANRKYDCVIDIGSAEGYYACGLARMLGIPVYAYDPEPYEKKFSAMMAECNGISHLVTMANLFTVDDMRRHADQRILVVCDCEGFEETLFRPDTLMLSQKWDMLIELHGSAEATLPTLAWPHATQVLSAEPRDGLLNEYRCYPQHFLLCEARVD